MTINLYEYYAQHIDKVGPDQRKILRDQMLSCTPYYFSDPLPREDIMPYREQLNIPSPRTWIQMDLELKDGTRTLIWTLETETREVKIFTTQGNSIAAHLFGYFRERPDRIELSLYRTSDEPVEQQAVESYTTVLNLCLAYINRIGPRVIPHHSLSRQTRRSVQRSLGYPLKATTEIIIRQHEHTRRTGKTGEGGKKCWHEVKGHVRVYHRGTPDQFEVWIKPHDRGDPALGLKSTKYRVET